MMSYSRVKTGWTIDTLSDEIHLFIFRHAPCGRCRTKSKTPFF